MMLDQRFLVTGGSGFIGTHLIEELIERGSSVFSIDVNPPKFNHHYDRWVNCDILSIEQVGRIFDQFKPTHVLHLAAKANLKGRSIADFPENILGTKNVVRCVNASADVERFIHVSTQYVVRPGVWPETEEFLLPYTSYGVSKAEGERIIRNECNKCWVILRPTNVWGPYHPFFPYEMWKYLELRYYFHPGYKPHTKYYSYISNAVDQIMAIALAKPNQVCRRVYYITDPPIDNAEWMNAFSLSLSGKPVKKMPLKLWGVLAKLGDVSKRLGLRFPMSSERLYRLTVDEQVPFQPTIDLVGTPEVPLEEGVQRSVRWYQSFREGKDTKA